MQELHARVNAQGSACLSTRTVGSLLLLQELVSVPQPVYVQWRRSLESVTGVACCSVNLPEMGCNNANMCQGCIRSTIDLTSQSLNPAAAA